MSRSSSCFFKNASPANLVLYGSGLGWSCAGLLRQSTGVGPGYMLYLGGLWGGGGVMKVFAGYY